MTLTLSEYATEAARTAGLPRGLTPEESNLNAMALGLAGESGEFVDLVKKMLYHDKPVSIAEFTKELGDAIWYWVGAVRTLNDLLGTKVSVEDVLYQNVDKLRARYPDGFSAEASAARVDLLDTAKAPPVLMAWTPTESATRTIDAQEGSFVLGPGHQTDYVPFSSPFCVAHPEELCPEWCEGAGVAVA